MRSLYVVPAQAFRLGAIEEGEARNMLLRQHNFPQVYDKRDTMLSGDSDKLMEHLTDGEFHQSLGLDLRYRIRKMKDEEVFIFLIRLLRPEKLYPGMTWTGYRILATVMERIPVYTFELFAKHPKSETIVYSGDDAPNVKSPKSKAHR